MAATENSKKCACILPTPIQEINVPIIWVLGGPGSGKGTQCDKIIEKYGFTHLSTGDLLRAEVSSGSPRGKDLTDIMQKGELVSNDVVLDLLKEAILKAVLRSKGFLIDGYPREKEQENTLNERLQGRAKTSGRADDNDETIKERLHTFKTHNEEIIKQYNGKLKDINAERSPDEIFAEVVSYLDALVA